MPSPSLPLPRIFVQHVPKTAGTSLLSYLEPNVPTRRMHSSQQFWGHWSSQPSEVLLQRRHSAQPFIACTPPTNIESLRYAHGHYKDLFRQVLVADWFTIGTSRTVDSRLISMLNHLAREPNMDRRLGQYLQGEPLCKTEVLKALLQSSQIAFYSSFMPRMSLWKNNEKIAEDTERFAREAMVNLNEYDCMIDTTDFVPHCKRLAAFLPHPHNLGQRNTQAEFGMEPAYSQRHVDILRNDFPMFFTWEDKVYGRLRQRSAETLQIPLAETLERQQYRSRQTVTVFPDQADLSGMSIAIPTQLPGWEGAYYRVIEPNATLHHLPVIPGNYRGYIWLWCSDPERHSKLKIDLPGVKNLRCQTLFIENPSHHLWLAEIHFENDLAQEIDLTFSEPETDAPSFWLGCKLYWLGPGASEHIQQTFS